jgi:hypothetical protein
MWSMLISCVFPTKRTFIIPIKNKSEKSLRSMSEFDDKDMFIDTPLSRLVKRIRQLEQLNEEDINIINNLDNTTIVDLLFEYNCALRFNFALKNKTYL